MVEDDRRRRAPARRLSTGGDGISRCQVSVAGSICSVFCFVLVKQSQSRRSCSSDDHAVLVNRHIGFRPDATYSAQRAQARYRVTGSAQATTRTQPVSSFKEKSSPRQCATGGGQPTTANRERRVSTRVVQRKLVGIPEERR
jgi:hypothetical protein